MKPTRRCSMFAPGFGEQQNDAIRRVIRAVAEGLTGAAQLPEGDTVSEHSMKLLLTEAEEVAISELTAA